MRILLIEDSLQLAEAIREFFRLNGIQVDICGDGKQGYEQAQRERYDAMILDLMLPTMSGFDILAKLREAGVDTPTIILSAKTQMDDKLRGFNTGADDYLGKPFDMKELLEKDNPLFNRFSLILHLKEMDYFDAAAFYPGLSPYERIAFYSVFGGSPNALSLINQEASLEENIKALFLNENAPLRFQQYPSHRGSRLPLHGLHTRIFRHRGPPIH